MSDILTSQNERFPKSRYFEKHVAIAKPDHEFQDLIRCKVTLKWHSDKQTPLFKVSSTNGGMAYPEVLRAYATLLTHVADQLEGKEAIDFQI